MTPIKQVLIKLLRIMREDLKRRSYDEDGEQREETFQRIETLTELINTLESKETEHE